ncbi:MAG: MotA/TolQ/ExbB proton channel family protein [Verrucomicrobiales bacterium]
MWELIQRGGPLMWVLLACSVAVIMVFAERLLYYHRISIDVSEFLQGLRNLLRRKNYPEALSECAGTPGPVARVVHTAVLHHERSRADLKEITREAGQLEVPKLERHLYVLATIAYAAPLIGFLGTVLGLLDSFMVVAAQSGYSTANDLARGIYQALVATSCGLAIGIPAYVGYNYLSARVNHLLHQMERAGIEVVALITENDPEKGIIAFQDQRHEAKA